MTFDVKYHNFFPGNNRGALVLDVSDAIKGEVLKINLVCEGRNNQDETWTQFVEYHEYEFPGDGHRSVEITTGKENEFRVIKLIDWNWE